VKIEAAIAEAKAEKQAALEANDRVLAVEIQKHINTLSEDLREEHQLQRQHELATASAAQPSGNFDDLKVSICHFMTVFSPNRWSYRAPLDEIVWQKLSKTRFISKETHSTKFSFE